jgi:hypothetical protein
MATFIWMQDTSTATQPPSGEISTLRWHAQAIRALNVPQSIMQALVLHDDDFVSEQH